MHTDNDGSAHEPALRYRFGRVVLETHGRRLLVDGRERPMSRRAFDLLLILVRAPRRVHAREALIDALWPGGQIVSDEALTQAVFRVRAVLGADGEHIATVRGVGIRLDADVSVESSMDAVEMPTPAPAAIAEPRSDRDAADERASEVAPPAPPPKRRRRLTRPVIALAALILIVVAIGLLRRHQPVAVDAGYGIDASDVHAAQADGARLLGEAIAHDNGGDRARAHALLETLHDSDATTPWPAMLIGLWSVGAGNMASADEWLARAHERAAPLRDPYVNAMLRYIDAERGGGAQDIIRYAGAVLDLRPGAWRMHLARAHLKHYQGLREAALAEIRQIDVRELGNRKLEGALADRASFGDVAGAQAVLDGLARTTDAAAWEYLAGRIAWSRGDRVAAREAWERASTEAKRNGRSDIGNRAEANAGLAAMLTNDRAAAIAHFERARVGMTEAGWITDEIDLSLLLAQMHALDGRTDAALAEFERAIAIARRGGDLVLQVQIALIGARLFPSADLPLGDASEPAALALLSARRAQARKDTAAAREDLQTAVRRGALDSLLADEARLLAAELGLPVVPEKPLDPPYPPLSAAAARLFMPAERQEKIR